MKMKTKKEFDFDAVKYMREQRDSLSEKLNKMTTEEIVKYFADRRLENGVRPCA